MRLHPEPRKAPKHNTINVCTKLETCKLRAKASQEFTTEQVRPASLSQPHPTRARHSQPGPARASQPDTRPNIPPASQPASQPEPAGQPANQPTARVSQSQPARQPASQSEPADRSQPARQADSQPGSQLAGDFLGTSSGNSLGNFSNLGREFPREFLGDFFWGKIQAQIASDLRCLGSPKTCVEKLARKSSGILSRNLCGQSSINLSSTVRQKHIRQTIVAEIIRRHITVKIRSIFYPSKILRQKIGSRHDPSKNVTTFRSRNSIRLRNALAEACHPEARPRTLFPEDLHLYRMRCSPRKPGPKVSFDSRACRQCVLAPSFQVAYAGE